MIVSSRPSLHSKSACTDKFDGICFYNLPLTYEALVFHELKMSHMFHIFRNSRCLTICKTALTNLCLHCLLKLSTYVTQLYVPIVRRTKNQLFHQSAVENDFFHQFFPRVFVSVWEFWYAVHMFYVSCSPPAFRKDLSASIYRSSIHLSLSSPPCRLKKYYSCPTL